MKRDVPAPVAFGLVLAAIGIIFFISAGFQITVHDVKVEVPVTPYIRIPVASGHWFVSEAECTQRLPSGLLYWALTYNGPQATTSNGFSGSVWTFNSVAYYNCKNWDWADLDVTPRVSSGAAWSFTGHDNGNFSLAIQYYDSANRRAIGALEKTGATFSGKESTTTSTLGSGITTTTSTTTVTTSTSSTTVSGVTTTLGPEVNTAVVPSGGARVSVGSGADNGIGDAIAAPLPLIGVPVWWGIVAVILVGAMAFIVYLRRSK